PPFVRGERRVRRPPLTKEGADRPSLSCGSKGQAPLDWHPGDEGTHSSRGPPSGSLPRIGDGRPPVRDHHPPDLPGYQPTPWETRPPRGRPARRGLLHSRESGFPAPRIPRAERRQPTGGLSTALDRLGAARRRHDATPRSKTGRTNPANGEAPPHDRSPPR